MLFISTYAFISYPLLSTLSTQEDPSGHGCKIVEWDVKDQNKQTNKQTQPFLSCAPPHLTSIEICDCSLLLYFVDISEANSVESVDPDRIVSMTRKSHNHTLQTNPQYSQPTAP